MFLSFSAPAARTWKSRVEVSATGPGWPAFTRTLRRDLGRKHARVRKSCGNVSTVATHHYRRGE